MPTHHRRCRSITSFINARQAAIQSGLGSMTRLNIMVTAHQVRWNAVENRIASHPSETRQLDENGKSILFLALSRRMEDYPTQKTIRNIIAADPCAVWEGIADLHGADSDGAVGNRDRQRGALDYASSPLIIAASRRAKLEILQYLVQGRPSIPSQDIASLVSLWNSYRVLYHGSEEILIGLLFEGGRESFAIYSKLHSLLHYCTAPGNRLQPWPEGGTTLHRAAAVPDCSTRLFQVILHFFPKLCWQRDLLGRLPLHSLLRGWAYENQKETRWNQHLKLDRLKLLMEYYPQAASHRDVSGSLPLHTAIASGWNYPHLSQLVDAFPQALSLRDEKMKLYPFQLAAAQSSSLSTIYELLQMAPALATKNLATTRQEGISCRAAEPNIPEGPKNNTNTGISSLHPFEKFNSAGVIPNELRSLLQHVKNMNDSRLWQEVQQLLRWETARKTSAEWLGLHAAVSIAECPIGFIRVLIHVHPEQLAIQDQSMGRTPLHYAAANSSKSRLATTPPTSDSETDLRTLRLQEVLNANHSAAQLYDHDGQLPLHLALTHGMPAACLEALILVWPESLCRKDSKHALHPFLLAARSPVASLNDVFVLLLRAPHVLAEATGTKM